MARTEIPIVVIDPATGNAVTSANVTVVNRATSANATIYAGETGSTTVANPRVTDSNGRLTGWVERGGYRLDITGSGLTAYSKSWDSAPATDASVDTAWLAPGSAANTFVSARSTTTRAGTLSSSIVYIEATITLTAGTWLVTSGGALINLTTIDDGVAGIYNRTTSAEVASSRGGQVSTSTTTHQAVESIPTLITVAASTTFCPIFDRNGGSTIRAQSAASGAAGYITGIKVG